MFFKLLRFWRQLKLKFYELHFSGQVHIIYSTSSLFDADNSAVSFKNHCLHILCVAFFSWQLCIFSNNTLPRRRYLDLNVLGALESRDTYKRSVNGLCPAAWWFTDLTIAMQWFQSVRTSPQLSTGRKNTHHHNHHCYLRQESHQRLCPSHLQGCCTLGVQYFQQLVKTDVWTLAWEHSAYTLQKTGNLLDASKKNLNRSLDCSLGRNLWAICETESRYPSVADMSKNKFLNIVVLHHCVNNMWKIRPWFASIRENCLNSCLMISI